MQIVVPMVGIGKRFQDAGYTLPKPLLDVDGVPMIVRVVQDLPAATKTIFVINREHVRNFGIDRVIKSYFPTACLVIADKLTEGQACSVQLASPHLNQQESVLVAACDNTHLFDQSAWRHATSDAGVDALIWTYRGEPRVLVNPNWYGWVAVDSNSTVQHVSVKRPISTDLLNDHVVSGTFWFKSAAGMSQGISDLVASNRRINHEFYLDSVPSLMTEQGRRVKVFEVDKYIGWGTPHDYQDYQKWSSYVRNHSDRIAA